MKISINLDAYFERIGYRGEQKATPEVLQELHLLHPKAIAFENLNPFLGIPVNLDPESLQQKLVHDERGGYCFEHNLLFKHVLEALGFFVKGLVARILWNVPENRITPRGHMLLYIEVDGKEYAADVGFGGLGLTGPLLLETAGEQETPHEPYQLIRNGGEYTLQSFVKDEWKSLYRFNLDEHFREDYEVINWYLSNHPESHFVTGLIAARSDINPKRRYALRGNELSIHTLNEGTEKRILHTTYELKETLEQTFRIKLPDVPQLDEKFEEIMKKGGI
ncbi:MAG: arylamine N-acetyltransferase [Balneolaceae bacterium]|nr:arylamine N-acetyltransferase [Balneolaceae bacterium]